MVMVFARKAPDALGNDIEKRNVKKRNQHDDGEDGQLRPGVIERGGRHQHRQRASLRVELLANSSCATPSATMKMIVRLLLCLWASASAASPTPPPGWKVNFDHRGALEGSNLESSPFALGGSLYLMASQMGNINPDGSCNSYFCVVDMLTGDQLSCPNASAGFAFSSAVTSVDGSTVWVFGSARNRCSSCPNFGCGPCDVATGKCFIGAWSSTGPSSPGGDWVWNGPFHALDLPPNVTAYNVGVGVVPAGAPVPPGLPPNQAFMALEADPAPGGQGQLLAINTGADGDLGKNWVLLNYSTHVLGPWQDICQAGGCPSARYADGYYYVLGGGVDLARSANLSIGSWERPPLDPVAWGCTDGWEDCGPGSPVARIADGFFTNYWAQGKDNHMRDYLQNISDWNWSDSDVDFCDFNGTTYFIYSMNGQGAPANWTGKPGNFYQLGTFNGSEAEWLASFYAGGPGPERPCYDGAAQKRTRLA